MNHETLLPIITFMGVATGIWGVWAAFAGKSSRATERLDEWRDPFALQKRISGITATPNSVNFLAAIFNKAAPLLSKPLESKSELEQSDLKTRLANAGYTRHYASQNFLAIKIISLGVGLLLGGSYGLYSAGFAKNSWMSLVIAGGIGFFLPELILTLQKWSRQEKIFLQLPDALDLLVVCVEAGLGLDSGLRKVSEELATGAPEVCSELAIANKQLQMGKARREVLHDLGVRTGVDDVRALAAILIQADRFGSSIAQALRVQSDTMRVKRRQMAEEKAAKTAVKMIFPLVLFIFPGIFVILVGPAAIQLKENMLNN
ncbi:MAG: type II secretion system F family protein [Planctomycetales bacterium]|nr:type II secretion system F family protein [Planctomycetales bacterium]